MRCVRALSAVTLLVTVSSCATATMPIENRHWKLIALRDRPVTDADVQREPHLVLGGGETSAGTHRLTGSGGCNSLFGTYELDGSSLRFSAIGMTKMACARGMETETTFSAALDQVRSWRMAGQQLELVDGSGTVLARFEGSASP